MYRSITVGMHNHLNKHASADQHSTAVQVSDCMCAVGVVIQSGVHRSVT